MSKYTDTMNPYWNKRYLKENRIWGEKPSNTAIYALNLFEKYEVKKILIPGAGYGRNSKLFSSRGLLVSGIEISKIAVEIAEKYDPDTKFYKGSVLDMPYEDKIYDAIYCFNVLHLFKEQERKEFISKCIENIKINGLMFFTVFSDQEKSYVKGKEIEKDTFESKPGRPVHYFTEEDLLNHFEQMNTIETSLIEETENHGNEGLHIHRLRYICIQKR
ncbi:class I SAM-dependent methyltransferase [Gottschalkia acidurici]|nr:class I SAM-dependent methyltransferase [Gottschalkia acidurici]